MTIEIIDDGPGFPPALMHRIGDPYVTSRSPATTPDQTGAGLGLGVFIAKTLLERTGARITLANEADRTMAPSCG